MPTSQASSPPSSGEPLPNPGEANASAGGLARNALVSYLAMFTGTLAGLLVTPYLLRHLGVEHFAVWVLLLSTVGYLGLLEIGLYTTISKRVAESVAVDDRARLQSVLSTALMMYGALTVGVLLIGGALAALLPMLFRLRPDDVSLARHCLLLLTLNQMALFAFRLQPALLFGAGRMDLLAAVGTLYNLLTAVINVAVAWAGYDIAALAAGTLLTTFISGFIGRRLIRLHLPAVTIHARYADLDTARELLKFGGRNAVLSVAGTIAFGADALVIGLLLPVANVAHYTVAARLANFIRELCQKPVDVLLPAYSHTDARGDGARHFQLWSESISLSMAIALPFVIAAWVFGARIVAAWIGDGHEQSGLIFALLALMQWLQLPGHASLALLTGTERNAWLVRVTVVAALFNLLLSLILTRAMGPSGVAIASLIMVTLVDFCLLPIVVCRQFRFALRDYLAHSLRPLLLPIVVGIVVAEGGLRWHLKYFRVPPDRVATLLLLGALCLICWTAWFTTGLNRTRRSGYIRALRAALKR